jgi:hypothetical protein
MEQEQYIRPKKKRTEIISLYKRMVKANNNVIEFEQELEKLGWTEITIQNITNYLMVWNYKEGENTKMIRKEEDYKFIKKFTGISVNRICSELNIDYANLMKGKASIQNTRLVRERLQEEIKKLEE